MKSFAAVALTALCTVQNVAAHATFQALWVDGADFGGQCARQPASNSPVTNVASNDLRCNAGSSRPAAKCAVKAGSTVTVEMHQQPNDRSCASEAIGGAHYGPVMVYMSKVADATTADGSGGWFKIFQDTWGKNATGASGDDDFWGVKDLNKCCGKMSLAIPADLAPGDYLLRAEVIALHTAGSAGGAQLYMTCYQISVTGSGSATPPTVVFPGAYKAADPGILVNIHAALATYVAPGPTVYAGGSTKKAGSACSGCEATCAAGAGPSATASTVSVPLPTGGGGGGTGGCTVAKYAQCGGNGYTGCTTCGSGAVCSAVSPPYYSQCV
ncbi:glycosyl hydrolase family 61-domain-containing protein [Lasiosphaeria miniovina]|uniref:lytic cellulose monooxygenase (C4-dehydrogenating) n=1 Tax=Lasiosphaeria miniovina TaxID=1954250 RepID=A0AA40AM83_9PEZI|nr:glycosyl hydrolase family 61-domain-containing protein [Lasiosphaeria miniovina]KAK0718435.1 glycosyl hydrolase family 61-domain-containing protein [Lasiosphaeria miniovina]